MDIAIYSRISTDKQDNQNQLAQLRAFAKTQGWRIKHEYLDVASGKNGDREQFKALFDAASRRAFDLVLFWSLDRFSREGVLETLQYLQRLTAYGVGYRSFSEQYLDSCGMFKDAVISILAIIAKQERVRLSERTIAGLLKARAQGRVGGRPRIQCDKAEVIRLYQAGHSLGSIAKEMTLTKTTVHRIIAWSKAQVSAHRTSPAQRRGSRR
jgi:DNA invertase Pin-like site-specific DNA recombinase